MCRIQLDWVLRTPFMYSYKAKNKIFLGILLIIDIKTIKFGVATSLSRVLGSLSAPVPYYTKSDILSSYSLTPYITSMQIVELLAAAACNAMNNNDYKWALWSCAYHCLYTITNLEYTHIHTEISYSLV